jgi:amino acid adenylation domain-containing protein/non-ribosomal peptide synthase protein (TIGR01720 family)
LFEEATVARLAGHLETLLGAVAADPDRALSALPLVEGAERDRLLVAWNDTDAPRPEATLVELFEAQVAATPDATAVVCGETRLSYGELNEGANRLAHHLRGLGVGPDIVVGLCLERGVELIVALVGILKAGGAYLPLDPDYPAERLASMLDDAAVAVLVTDDRLAAGLPRGAAGLVRLDGDRAVIAAHPAANPTPSATPDHLAYVIYTSGSTGRPKGVMITHRAIVNRLVWMQEAFALGSGDDVLHKTPIGFDVSVWELVWPLLQGARLVLCHAGDHRDPARLSALMHDHGISVVHFVPSMLRAFLNATAAKPPPSLRLIVCSGEAMTPELRDAVLARSAARLVNLYGPTEASIDVSYADLIGTGDVVPIGGPIANTRLYVLDGGFELVPVGVGGELHIGGVGVARGYLGRPGLTAERFVADPFGPPGGRLYRSGDRVRWRPDGTLEFLGRLDDQVKIRGQRVEPGEVVAALRAHPGVADAAVVARDAPETRLVAYVVAAGEARLTASALGRFLRRRLPEAMVPAAFVVVAGLPLTPNGKLDRAALPAPEGERPDLAEGYVAPRTPVETALAGIWAAVLGLERVGVTDNFFELGGDSILSIQVVAQARTMGLCLRPRDVFEHQTVAELAELATAVPAYGEETPDDGEFPLTPIQHWFFDQDRPHPDHFNQAWCLLVPADTDAVALADALGALVAHHAALRLRFWRDAGWHQAPAAPPPTPELSVVDVGADAAELAPAVEGVAARLQASLDLGSGRLIAAALCRCGPRTPARLVLVAHHLVVDGVSWRILLGDLNRAYGQLRAAHPPALAPVGASYRRWAEHLVGYAASGALDDELASWAAQAHPEPVGLPVDHPGGANTVASARTLLQRVPAELTGALLHDVPAAQRSGIHELLLAALVATVTSWTRHPQLLVDIEGHGREDLAEALDLSRTVGWFTALFPVLFDLGTTAPAPLDALHAVRTRLRAVARHGVGYGLLRWLRPPAAAQLGAAPRPQVAFNYLGQLDQALSGPLVLGVAPEPTGAAAHPAGHRTHLLELNGRVVAGELQLAWTYSAELHRPSTVETLAADHLRHLTAIAEAATATPTRYHPEDFPLAGLSQEQLSRLVQRRQARRGRDSDE